jgi:hypothetical protein
MGRSGSVPSGNHWLCNGLSGGGFALETMSSSDVRYINRSLTTIYTVCILMIDASR